MSSDADERWTILHCGAHGFTERVTLPDQIARIVRRQWGRTGLSATREPVGSFCPRDPLGRCRIVYGAPVARAPETAIPSADPRSLRSFAPAISMMKAAEPSTGDYCRSRWRLAFHWPSIRRVLIEGIVNAVVLMVVHVIANEPSEMSFVQRDDMVENLSAAASTQRSAIPFCQGAWTLVRFGLRPVAFRNAITSPSNFESWSRMA